MKKSILEVILNKCKRTLKSHPEYENFPHWTFLVQDNQIVSQGLNRKHEPSLSLGYHNCKDKSFIPKWHSEPDSIKRCVRILNNFSAINVRLNRQGQMKMSMPCKTCRRILSTLNCKKVYFTTEFGWQSLTLRNGY